MKLFWRQVLTAILCGGLIQAPAYANDVKAERDRKDAEFNQEVDDFFDLAITDRKNETLAEVWYRIETRLDESEKNDFAKILANKGREAAPLILKDGRTLVLRQDGREVRLDAGKTNGELSIKINGRELKRSAKLADVSYRIKEIERILKATETSKKTSIFQRLFLPELHAFDWMTAGISALLGAVVGWMAKGWWDNKNSSTTSTCTVNVPSCCVVGSNYITHSNGCCQQIGGLLSTNTPAGNCTGSATTSTAYPSTAVPSSVSGQR